ncbi:MAG: ABC transporter permease [Nonlabens sp.]
MLRLLNIEFHKFKYSKSSIVLTSIYLAVIVILLSAGAWRISIKGQSLSLADIGVFNFPFLWHLSTYMVSFLKFLIAIVIVSLTASEYSNRTLKQNLIDGLSKKELILSKFYLVVVLSVVVTVVLVIACLILGLLYSDYTEANLIFRELEYIGAFFISHLTFFSMCLFAGILVKRSAFALGLIGIWAIFESILLGISQWIEYAFEVAVWDTLGNILPIYSISNLIIEPFSRVSLVKSTLEMADLSREGTDYGVPLLNVGICVVWTALFVYWSYALLKRRDL